MIRPRGTPPMPSAMSRLSAPLEIASTCKFCDASPIRMTAPTPNCRSMSSSALLSASASLVPAALTRGPAFLLSDALLLFHFAIGSPS